MREVQKKELLLLKFILRKEDQDMGPDSGITIKIPPTEVIRFMDRIGRTVDDYSTDDLINSPTETMEIDRLMGIPIVEMDLGKILEFFLVRHLDKDGTFFKVILPVDPNPYNLEIRHLEYQMLTQTLVLLLTNKNFRKATTKHQQTWFASPPLMIALTSYQNFVR